MASDLLLLMFPKTHPPKSICILRLSALGDVTHVLPVLNAIRQQWPQVDITWICGSIEHRLLSCIPDVRFVVFDKKAGIGAYRQVRKQLAGHRFDVLLHMQVAARANLLSMFIKADVRVGWDKASSRDLHQLFINRRIVAGRQRHQVESFLAFAQALGVETVQPEWDFPVPDEAYGFATEHLDNARKTLLISPCSSHAMRNWSSQNYARVADHAISELGMQVILSGGPSEFESNIGAQIEQAMHEMPLNLIGEDTLQQSMALLEKVDVVIAPDTGPAHMANAMGTRVIGLYACTSSKRSGPYNSLDICIDRYAEAAERFLGKNSAQLAWGKKIEQAGVMELISVDDVIEKLDQVVSQIDSD